MLDVEVVRVVEDGNLLIGIESLGGGDGGTVCVDLVRGRDGDGVEGDLGVRVGNYGGHDESLSGCGRLWCERDEVGARKSKL